MVNDDRENGAGMTDLADRLQGPERIAVSKALRARLSELRLEIQADLNAGVPLDDAIRYNSVLQALAAAEKVVLLAARPSVELAGRIG